ncbi:MAG: o-succinylbenzoate synthase [Chitinophagales bacterium]|nr:o-succinylbenzoate synthase [Bacteroidota bacterium]MCB9043490.1 o-succinylbenzoate synthase [Chitinophagales bacterium]
MQAYWKKYTLQFKQAAGTSRGVLHTKDSYFIFLYDAQNPNIKGIGECGVLQGLSIDDTETYEQTLYNVCKQPQAFFAENFSALAAYPSIRFGVEMAYNDWKNGGKRHFFATKFTEGGEGININGLVWMGDKTFMQEQIDAKIAQGFSCIKMKIGAIDFETEWKLLKKIRQHFSPEILTLRVDANGAFSPKEAVEVLRKLADLAIHSIEQPIKAGQIQEMAQLCQQNIVPIALDEELLGVLDISAQEKLLDQIRPQFLIIKPSLLGGFAASQQWISLAEARSIAWWITSALESNVGLNAIAQWCAHLQTSLPQGLGTGQLYTNNFASPLEIAAGKLYYRPEILWNLRPLQ